MTTARGGPILIGTRGSALSRVQTEEVASALREHFPHLQFFLRIITTRGDRDRVTPLPQLGLSIFTKELEQALLAGEVRMAVHSLKDLATELPPGLTIAAVPPRRDPRDALVSRTGMRLAELPSGACIGTSSPRRAALIRALRPDVQVHSIRGNVETRLRKALKDGAYDAVVLAAVGLERLGLQGHIAQYFDPFTFVPAVGQGALAVETREDDAETLALAAAIDHRPSHAAARGERAFLRALGGGCKVPMAAYGQMEGQTLRLVGLVASPDGQRVFRAEVAGAPTQPEAAGRQLVQAILTQAGARELVAAEGGA